VLQIDQDLEFQRRFERAERAALLLSALVLAAAALGVFGAGGPLAAGDGYDRCARLGSTTEAAIVVATLISLDRALGWLSHRSQRIDRWANDVPLVLIGDGRLCRDRMDRMRIDDDDILESARELKGLERMDQIEHAALERTGAISVIPRRP
jgi:uncharacterized protein DUF421